MMQRLPAARTVDVSRLIDEQKAGPFAILLIASAWLVMLTDGYELSVLAFAAPLLIRAWHIERAVLGPGRELCQVASLPVVAVAGLMFVLSRGYGAGDAPSDAVADEGAAADASWSAAAER